MINPKLINPKSIVVCGASSDIHKPGGKALKNLLESAFKGEVYAVNPKEDEGVGLCKICATPLVAFQSAFTWAGTSGRYCWMFWLEIKPASFWKALKLEGTVGMVGLLVKSL